MTKLSGKDWRTGREPANEQERIAFTTAGLGEFCGCLRATISKVPILRVISPSEGLLAAEDKTKFFISSRMKYEAF